MKNIFVIGLLFLSIATIQAQNGTIRGKIVSEQNNILSNVTIFILSSTKGTASNENGEFEIKNIAPGNYTLLISFVGYENQEISINVAPNETTLTPLLILKKNVSQLSEVLISSKIGASEIRPQKITYSVDKLASQAGGTAGDILKNMPSVSMGGSPNENRYIQYRGLGKEYTKVLINGRNSGYTGDERQTILSLIPASQIERIEIESNPSADSQSDGVNGIVNIILKDGVAVPGSSGSVGFIVDSEDGYNGSSQFNQTFEKFQFSVGIDKLTQNLDRFDDGIITEFDDNGIIQELTTTDRDEHKFYDNTGARLKLNFSPSDNLSFQAEYLYGNQDFTKLREELNLMSNPDGSFKKGKARVQTEDINLNYHNAYLSTQAKVGIGLLEAGINVNLSEGSEFTLRNDFKTDTNGNILELDDPKRRQQIQSISTDVILPSLNYQINLNGIFLKAGYQGFYTEFTFTQDDDKFNFAEGVFENSDASEGNFVIQEDVHAFFALAEWYKDKWSIEGGLRYEIADVTSTSSVDTIPRGENNYDFLLPNLHIVYNLTDKSYLNFSLGRRLRRPSPQDLNPFVEIKDLTEIRTGNPDLIAESSWAYELGYLRKFNKFDFGSNIFVRDITDLIQENKFQNAEGIIVEAPTNLNGAVLYGAEFFVNAKITNWWNTNLSYSRFDSNIKDTDSNFDGDALEDQTQWTGKAINDFNLSKSTTLQIAGNVVGPQESSQITEEIIWSFDAGLEKRFLRNGTFVLRVVDLFDSLGKDKAEFVGNQTERKTENTQGQIFSAGLKWNF